MSAEYQCSDAGCPNYARAAIRMTLHDRTEYVLDVAGYVTARSDGPTAWQYGQKWRILGFMRRWNSSAMVTLADALNGADIGHGYVIDLDHGTRRMWASPPKHRAARVERMFQPSILGEGKR